MVGAGATVGDPAVASATSTSGARSPARASCRRACSESAVSQYRVSGSEYRGFSGTSPVAASAEPNEDEYVNARCPAVPARPTMPGSGTRPVSVRVDGVATIAVDPSPISAPAVSGLSVPDAGSTTFDSGVTPRIRSIIAPRSSAARVSSGEPTRASDSRSACEAGNATTQPPSARARSSSNHRTASAETVPGSSGVDGRRLSSSRPERSPPESSSGSTGPLPSSMRTVRPSAIWETVPSRSGSTARQVARRNSSPPDDENASSAARINPVSRPVSEISSSSESLESITTGSGPLTPGTAATRVGTDANGHTIVNGTDDGSGPGCGSTGSVRTVSSSSPPPGSPGCPGASSTGSRVRVSSRRAGEPPTGVPLRLTSTG